MAPPAATDTDARHFDRVARNRTLVPGCPSMESPGIGACATNGRPGTPRIQEPATLVGLTAGHRFEPFLD